MNEVRYQVLEGGPDRLAAMIPAGTPFSDHLSAGSVLMEPTCSKALVNMREAPDYRADKHAQDVIRSLTKKDQFLSVDVVLRGTFRVAHEGQCFGEMCEPYEIQVEELLCAEKSK